MRSPRGKRWGTRPVLFFAVTCFSLVPRVGVGGGGHVERYDFITFVF